MNVFFARKFFAGVTALTLLITSTQVDAKAHKESKNKHGRHDLVRDLLDTKSIKKQLRTAAKKIKGIGSHKRKSCCEPTLICQKLIDKVGGTLVLHKSGDYALTQDVTGTIVIAADSVCLDLCCHTLSAAGRASAVIANGNQALKVFNGRITNSSEAAIFVTNCSGVGIYDLTLTDHSVDAICQINSMDINVHDVNFINSDIGERALLFDTCNNVTVDRCNISGYLSTAGAIVQLQGCTNMSVQDVDVSQCTKTSAGDIGQLSVGTALVAVDGCKGIDFVHVKVNNNTINNTVAVLDQPNQYRTAEAIAFWSSSGCSLYRCETSNNVDVAGSGATLVTEDYFLAFKNCSSVIVTEHQSSNNSCPVAIASFVGIVSIDSSSMVFDGCQANDNTIDELVVLGPGTFSQMHGIWVRGGSSDTVVRNCQTNGNTATKGGEGRSSEVFNPGVFSGIRMNGEGHVIDNCQANHNKMGDKPDFTFVAGILNSTATNAVTSNSVAHSNTGGQSAYGIAIHPVDVDVVLGMNQVISNCTANSNGNFGISANLLGDPLPEAAVNITIVDCVCNSNGSDVGLAAGIIVLNPDADRNVLIKGCQVSDTGSDASTEAAGIQMITASNVVIEDTEVFNTTAVGQAHGIVFDSITDSKILRTQVHGNKNAGILLTGENVNVAIIECVAMGNTVGFEFAQDSTASCCLVQDSRALSNRQIDFLHALSPLTTTFVGNEAQCNSTPATNATNYSITGGTISLQEMSVGSGVMVQVPPTTAGLGSRYVNVSVLP